MAMMGHLNWEEEVHKIFDIILCTAAENPRVSRDHFPQISCGDTDLQQVLEYE